jgi:FKBP-type peptidyl-prolyl cis-trans isomerase
MKPVVAALLAVAALAAQPASAQDPKKQDEEKALYGVGLALANNLEVFALSPAELETVIKGLRDGVAHKPRFTPDEKLNASINELARSRKSAADAKEAAAGPEYLKKMAAAPGATKTASGAIVISQKAGGGATPAPTDKVKVHYVGKFIDGREFDSSYKRNAPAEFPLNGVIKCWTEALQAMKVGGKATVVCPSDIAYGPQGRPGIPGNAVLTFDVELLDIVK